MFAPFLLVTLQLLVGSSQFPRPTNTASPGSPPGPQCPPGVTHLGPQPEPSQITHPCQVPQPPPPPPGHLAPQFNRCAPKRNWSSEQRCWEKMTTIIDLFKYKPSEDPPAQPQPGATEREVLEFRQKLQKWQAEVVAPGVKAVEVKACYGDNNNGVISAIQRNNAKLGIAEDVDSICCNLKCHCEASKHGAHVCEGALRPQPTAEMQKWIQTYGVLIQRFQQPQQQRDPVAALRRGLGSLNFGSSGPIGK